MQRLEIEAGDVAEGTKSQSTQFGAVSPMVSPLPPSYTTAFGVSSSPCRFHTGDNTYLDMQQAQKSSKLVPIGYTTLFGTVVNPFNLVSRYSFFFSFFASSPHSFSWSIKASRANTAPRSTR